MALPPGFINLVQTHKRNFFAVVIPSYILYWIYEDQKSGKEYRRKRIQELIRDADKKEAETKQTL